MSKGDERARSRLLAYSLVRLCGLVIFFIGISIIYTNLIRPGGWPQAGALVVILGAVAALLAPRVLRQAWDRADEDKQ